MKYSRYTLFFLVLLGCHSKGIMLDHSNIENSIRLRLKKQQDSWNTGDIDVFMQTYWNDPQLTFIGSRGPTYGWNQTLENYKKSYPESKAMGRLHFDILETEVLAHDAAYVLGKYTLYRESDEPSGYFTLLWRKIDNQWYIVSDHTSG